MKKPFFIILCLCVIISSCATLGNKPHKQVQIFADQEAHMIFNGDTLSFNDNRLKIFPKRSKDSLKLELLHGETSQQFAFKSNNSFNYYLNILCNYGIGMLVDANNDKRYTYANNINLEYDNSKNKFFVSDEALDSYHQHTLFIYTSPLQALDVFSTPMLTLGAEHFFMDNLSLSAEYGTIYTERFRTNPSRELVKNKGNSLRLEFKYYDALSIVNNPRINEYIGIEARFLRHQFTDDISYNIIDNDISYIVNEDIIVQKKTNIFNLKYGMILPLGKRLYFDVYTGFGIRLRDVKNPNRFFDPDIHDLIENDNIFYSPAEHLDYYRKKQAFNFSLGFKFGIKL